MGKFSLRSLFTLITGKDGRITAIKTLFIVLCCLSGRGYAAVTVTPATGGTNICSSKAIGSTAPAFTMLGTISITEGNNADFFGPATDVVVLTAPAGWQFNSASLPVFGYTTGSNVTSVTGSITSTTLTINIAVNNINGSDQVTITGLQVQATSTGAAAGNILCTSITGGTIAGITPGSGAPSFGSLSLMAPLTPSVTIAGSPSGAICAGTNVLFTPTPVNGGASPAYQWYLNGTSMATGATYANSSLANGNTVYCVMTAAGSCITTSTATSNTVTMVVHPTPLPVTGLTATCIGGTLALSDATTAGTWSSGNTAVAGVDGSGNVTGVSVGTSIISYFAAGCFSNALVTINNPPLAPALTPTLTTLCAGGVATVIATGTPAPTVVLSQTFNSGLGSWTVDNPGSSGMLAGGAWKVCGDGYVNEQGVYHSPDASSFAMSNADTSGSTSFTSTRLVSPVFSLVAYSGATLTFQQAYAYWPSGDFYVNLEISTDGGGTWATMQNYAGPSIGTMTGFVTETFSLNGYLGQPNLRIRYYYYCHWGYYWALDNVLIAGIPSVVIPTWSPATDLFTNAGATTPYVTGTAYDTLYVHPPSISTTGSVVYTVTATSSGCTAVSHSTVNFTPSPAPISGNTSVCVGATTTLSDVTGVGTWSSGNTAVAAVASGTGVVSGVSPGTAIITYMLGTGCTATTIVTVNLSPGPISGSLAICMGATGSLSDPTTAGGTWTSGSTGVATIASIAGTINPVSAGTSIITYALAAGCITTKTVTINPLPATILGTTSVCMGLTTNLSDASAGGSWSTSAASTAGVVPGTGVVSGVNAGTAYITYTLPTGCLTSTIVTVNALLPITGSSYVCAGYTTNLTDAVSGGTWSSSNLPVATAGSATGVVTGVTAGTAVISYRLSSGCTATSTLTVNALPLPIGGTKELCAGATASLTDATTGGVWSSSNTGVAVMAPTTGTIGGISAGTSIISYTLSSTTGCFITTIATVDPLPLPITGGLNVCTGLTTILSDTSPGGTWSSNDISIATVAISTGVATGLVANTVLVTYTLPTGCIATAILTVNPLPASILGNLHVCVNATTNLGDVTPGGTWASSNTSVATITLSGTGVVSGITAGTSIISYILSTGCMITSIVTVDPLPSPITGASAVCVGLSINLSDVGSGTWSSGNNSFATVGSGSGVVTGVSSGVVSIIYTLPTSCAISKNVTVNALPTAINGNLNVCVGSATSLSDGTAGGTWSSGSPGIGTVGSASGSVTGMASGTANITYSLSTGCITVATVTVNPLPAVISGNRSLCLGGTSSLSDAVTGGTWFSSNTSNALIGLSSGLVVGLGTGTSTIIYTDGGTSCTISAVVTVNPLPVAISGASGVCTGFTISLSDGSGGGTWSSGDITIATVGSSSGIVSGIAPGPVTIVYTLPTGCTASKTVTVYQSPSALAGIINICQGATTNLTDTYTGGTWTSGTTSVALIGTGGVAAGIAQGTSVITYSLAGGCSVTTTLTVNLTPVSITGISSICAGSATNLTDATAGGNWSSSNTITATVGAGTGLVSGLAAGSTTISYTVGSCSATLLVTVNTMPVAISGSFVLCQGVTTNLTDAVAGGSWASSNSSVAGVGTGSGTVTGVSTGTATITYGYPSGCHVTQVVTVNAMPATISGNSNLCNGFTETLSDGSAGGSWSSGTPSVATIGSTGLVTSVSVGSTIITYAFASGCAATKTVVINPQPSAINGTTVICAGSVTTLTDGIGSGSWTSSNTAVATVGSATGLLTGTGGGTSLITYSLGAGCIATTIVTVNLLPSSVAGTAFVCVGGTTSLSDPIGGGGTWSSGSTGIATVGSNTGIVNGISAGTATITYSLGVGCTLATIITVNPLPTPITESNNLCLGSSVTLTDASAGGTWSSSNTGTIPIGTSSGIAVGNATGTATITYRLGTGCYITSVVTVYPLPASISGSHTVCVGLASTLSDATGGGTWSSDDGSIATIGSGSGLVSGVSDGTTTISYTLNTGCNLSIIFTVNPLPPGISGSGELCVGATTVLTDGDPGGSWSSGSSGIATVGSATGIVSGIAAGTSRITYTLPTGCIITTIVTVHPLPASITGNVNVCAGSTTSLSDITSGGTWSSGSPGVAAVGTSAGIVLGMSAGSAVITYMLATGCISTLSVTVTALPAAISGPGGICVGTLASMSDATGGGTWATSNAGIAMIGSTSGTTSGIAAGTANITYTITIPTGIGCIAITTLTVNPLPVTISGTKTVCSGLTTVLSDGTSGGTWTSSNLSVATIGSASGIVSGYIAGTSVITYTIPAPTGGGCSTTAIVTVNPLPFGIMGTAYVCSGSSVTLSDASAGGTWSSMDGTIASIASGTGVATGVLAGTTTIIYTLPTSCITSQVITVNPLPSTITGSTSICQGAATNLSNATGGGTWSSNNPGVATIDILSGFVSGVSAGVAMISYTLPTGCYATSIMTVHPLPAVITGNMVFCVGLTTNLSDGFPGGTWSSGNLSVAIATAGTGIVSGVSAGTANITYALSTGCLASVTVTVNTMAGISGNTFVCSGYTTVLSDESGTGTWSSTNTSVATISGFTGIVTGAASGTSTISFVLSAGCIATTVVTVSSLPLPVTGLTSVCVGLVTNLSDASGGGSWSDGSPGIAAVNGSTGAVTGVSAGVTAITYTIGTGCAISTLVTVNPLPEAISGTLELCHGLTTTLTDISGGGNWSSGSPSIAGIGVATGIVSGTGVGTANITYTLPTTCIATTTVTVDPLPSGITGVGRVCAGFPTSLSDATPGGTWSSAGVGILTVDGSTGQVTGIAEGTAIVTYTLSTGCISTTIFTVNPLPAVISGDSTVCVGLNITLSDASSGGTWTSSAPSTAVAGAATGVISGMLAGTVVISYTLPTGCYITTGVTVNPLPLAINGTRNVCMGLTTILSDAATGGTWSSGSIGTATIGSGTGLVSGITPGVAMITYTLPTGCIVVSTVTVNSLPLGITGPANVCAGLTITMSDATAGGTWSSGATGIATISSSTGIVTGVSAGSAAITYTLNTGCISTSSVTVNPLPAAIVGSSAICASATTTFSDDTAGGIWSSGSPGVASVGSGSGIVTGASSGTASITYTVGTGCIASKVITINALPAAIGGVMHVCAGLTTSLFDLTGGGSWSSSMAGVATVGTGGSVLGVSAGTSVISYVLPTGCNSTAIVTVNPLPTVITGATSVCTGNTTTLSDATAGGTWSISLAGGIASIGSASGIVTAIGAGTTLVTYTLSTGCIATVTENILATPFAITGAMTVCTGLTTALSDVLAGGSWSSTDASVATVGGTTGIVSGISAGTSIISYALGSGCFATAVVTVNPLPSAISGLSVICTGVSYSLTDPTSGGHWSSGAAGTAIVNSVTGLLAGISTGTTIITYTLPTSCIATMGVTVNPSPVAITGTMHVCAGFGTTLTDGSAGGTWSSSNTAIAVVGSVTGAVSGVSAGVAVITYTLPSGCIAIANYTVNPLPSVIAGNRSICLTSTSAFNDTLTGGTWTIAPVAVATIGASSGIATGVSLGTAVITYSLPTGCTTSAIVTVNPYPVAIVGASLLCQGHSITLSDASSGGTWSSSNLAVATVGMTTGVVTGVSGGSAKITYTMSTGCFVMKSVTVNPLYPISGTTGLCEGSAYVFSDLAPGGTWSSGTTTVVSIGSGTGHATAIASGITLISYSLPSGCSTSVIVTVNVLPAAFDVAGGGSYCAGGTGLDIELNGSENGVNYFLYNGTSLVTTQPGTGAALFYGPYTAVGTYTVFATNITTGCSNNMTDSAVIIITPISAPSVTVTTTIGDTVCEGTSATFKALSLFGGSSPTYHWYVNGFSAGTTGPDSEYTYAPLNGDVVSVTMTSSSPCVMPSSATASFTVTTTPNLTPSVSISISPGDSVCATFSATIIPDPVNGGALPTYRWVKNGISAGWGSTYTYVPSNGDNIFCVIHSNYNCLVVDTAYSTNNINITVVPLLTPAVTVTAHPGVTITPGEADTLVATVSSGGAGLTYQWMINGSAVPGATTDTFISSSFANDDTVTCVTSGGSYCGVVSGTGKVIILVNDLAIQQTSGGAGNFRLIPNPNNGTFSVMGNGMVKGAWYNIEITDMLGQIVYKRHIHAANADIDEQVALGNSVANGMYLLRLSSDDSSGANGTVNAIFHFVVGK